MATTALQKSSFNTNLDNRTANGIEPTIPEFQLYPVNPHSVGNLPLASFQSVHLVARGTDSGLNYQLLFSLPHLQQTAYVRIQRLILNIDRLFLLEMNIINHRLKHMHIGKSYGNQERLSAFYFLDEQRKLYLEEQDILAFYAFCT